MLSLQAKIRNILGRKVKGLREKDLIPAVCYGHGIKPRSVEVSYLSFEKVFKEAGESSLIDLIIDKEKPVKVLIHDIQTDPLTDKIIHVDFYQVKAGEKITTEIALKFVGEPPVIKELGGVLVTNMDSLEVECLPKDLVPEIEVDISKLATFDDDIRVRDLKIPPGLEPKVNLEEVVVMIERPRTEEELKGELKEEEKPEEVSEEVKEKEEEEKEGEKKKKKKEPAPEAKEGKESEKSKEEKK
jgi:large subunit ribosomal protein L25